MIETCEFHSSIWDGVTTDILINNFLRKHDVKFVDVKYLPFTTIDENNNPDQITCALLIYETVNEIVVE